MSNTENLQLFEDQPIRTAWSDNDEEWYFSIVDVVSVLTEQATPRSASNYWAKLKQRLKEEGAGELLTNCQQLNVNFLKNLLSSDSTSSSDRPLLMRLMASL